MSRSSPSAERSNESSVRRRFASRSVVSDFAVFDAAFRFATVSRSSARFSATALFSYSLVAWTFVSVAVRLPFLSIASARLFSCVARLVMASIVPPTLAITSGMPFS